MGELFTTIITSFLAKSRGTSVLPYAIIILVFFLLWAVDYYSIVSRIDTYFTTGNMMRISEAKIEYKDNPEAMKVLDEMLANELEHQSVSSQYMRIFSLSTNQNNGRVWLINTLSSAGVYVLLFIPLTIYKGIQCHLKERSPFMVDFLTILTILACLLACVWFLQWLTNNIPTLFGCNIFNYILNFFIQIVALYITINPSSRNIVK